MDVCVNCFPAAHLHKMQWAGLATPAQTGLLWLVVQALAPTSAKVSNLIPNASSRRSSMTKQNQAGRLNVQTNLELRLKAVTWKCFVYSFRESTPQLFVVC